jgi:uncharacterized protein
MRTTLNLDDDVIEKAKKAAAKSGQSFRLVVNAALRAGLDVIGETAEAAPYRTSPHKMGLKLGKNLDNSRATGAHRGRGCQVILVDANILLYAEDRLSAQHAEAREWWDTQLSGSSPVCLCWIVIGAFVRIATNSRVFENPLGVAQAVKRVRSWLDQPCTRVIEPTNRHWVVFQQMLVDGQALGNLVTDAYLAALAIQHGCKLMSTDADFARFPLVSWTNPLR